MGVKKIKKYKSIIIIFLVFVMIFSFSIKPYADFVLVGLGIKVLATILASMGILTVVNNNGGVESFWNGLVEFGEQIKGIRDVTKMFVDVGVHSILTNTKMKISELSSLVREYYNKFKQEITDPPVIPKLPGVKVYLTNRANMKHSELLDKQPIIKQQLIGNYIVESKIYAGYTGSNNGRWLNFIVTVKTLDDSVVYTLSDIEKSFKLSAYVDIEFNFTSVAQLTDDTLRFDAIFTNLNYNTSVVLDKEIPILPLEGLIDYPSIPDISESDFPVAQTVPLGLAMPWEQALVNQTEAIGLTLSELYELVSSISLDAFVEKLAEFPKYIIDSLPQSEIITDSEGVITEVIPAEIPDTLPDIKEQTGILGSILAFLMNLFKFPEKIDIDLEPLQNLVLIDRFPFSLPWDLKNSFSLLVAPPVPPRFEIPFITENIVIDLAQFEVWAKISRTFSSILFVGGLILSTRKFIGGA